jgi:hypothetical protein
MRITVAAALNSPSISVASSNAGNRKDDEYSLEQWSSVKHASTQVIKMLYITGCKREKLSALTVSTAPTRGSEEKRTLSNCIKQVG